MMRQHSLHYSSHIVTGVDTQNMHESRISINWSYRLSRLTGKRCGKRGGDWQPSSLQPPQRQRLCDVQLNTISIQLAPLPFHIKNECNPTNKQDAIRKRAWFTMKQCASENKPSLESIRQYYSFIMRLSQDGEKSKQNQRN